MNAFDFTARDITGNDRPLSEWRGQVLLVVNVASQCGYTPQYTGLESLHRTLAPRGFAVLGFPCDQFGNQEPGTEEQIASFCSTTYGVSFPMFAKIEPAPKVRVVQWGAGVHTYQKAEPGLPLGIAAPVVGFYVDAIKSGYFLR